ncbi:hypothetical protein ACW6B7_004159 [Aeromonas veronii]
MVNIGFDINQRLLDGLENNVFTALAVQKPYKIGFVGVENAIDKINGKNTDAFIEHWSYDHIKIKFKCARSKKRIAFKLSKP